MTPVRRIALRNAQHLSNVVSRTPCVSERVLSLPFIHLTLGCSGCFVNCCTATFLACFSYSSPLSFPTSRTAVTLVALGNLPCGSIWPSSGRCVKRLPAGEADHGFWVLFVQILGDWEQSLMIVKAETLIRRYRSGFRRYGSW